MVLASPTQLCLLGERRALLAASLLVGYQHRKNASIIRHRSFL